MTRPGETVGGDRDPEAQDDDGLRDNFGTLATLERMLGSEIDGSLGYQVEMLEADAPQEPVDSKVALPFSFFGGMVSDEVRPVFAADLTGRLLRHPELVRQVPKPQEGYEVLPKLEYTIPWQEYQDAVADGTIAGGLFGSDGAYLGDPALFDAKGMAAPFDAQKQPIVQPEQAPPVIGDESVPTEESEHAPAIEQQP